jgi:hypothetical protein
MAAGNVRRVASVLVVATLAGAVAACGGAGSTESGSSKISSVSCDNYAIHADGAYHDEVSVQVTVSNSTNRAVSYTVSVEMKAEEPGRGDVPFRSVTVAGLVGSHTSAPLGHKVLTTAPVTSCRVIHVRSS